jgi:hypothetical protein
MIPVKFGKLNELLMMPDELDFMIDVIKVLPKDGLMVEWGSGGSTCKWLEVLTKNRKLISIEHNLEWYNNVKQSVSSHFGEVENFEFLYEADKTIGWYNRKYGDISEELPVGLESYIKPNEKIFNADLFFIDGIARGACLATTFIKKKPSARVFIHDFKDRQNWYSWITQFATVKLVGTTLAEVTL